jgi:hypothetical protein
MAPRAVGDKGQTAQPGQTRAVMVMPPRGFWTSVT